MDDRKDIFISYRRNGGEWLAYCLYSELILAGYSVFFDMRSLMGGKFEADIIKRIKESKVVIVVLPPKALDRCANKDDLVFEEIRTAIDSDKLVVPVFMKGFELPDKSLFAQEEVKDRYKYFLELEAFNGCEPNGIMDLDGMILRLKTLLDAVPVYADYTKTDKQFGYISVSSLFPIYSQNIANYNYKLLPNISSPEFFVDSSRDKEIAMLTAAINDMQPVYVYGFGGIGKK